MQRYQTNNFSSRRAKSFSRNQNTVKYSSNIKLGPVTHTVFVALVITVLGLIYLTQAAKITNYDYEAQKVDEQIATLSEQKDDLEVENARLTALNTITDSETAKAMTTPSSVNYISE
ncbi:hypothetical protein FWF48_02775 [Candidatus Saccharibacteria bacterium]|nr:hypothetical protein [Candidatus Saccharibacteria bacterium]